MTEPFKHSEVQSPKAPSDAAQLAHSDSGLASAKLYQSVTKADQTSQLSRQKDSAMAAKLPEGFPHFEITGLNNQAGAPHQPPGSGSDKSSGDKGSAGGAASKTQPEAKTAVENSSTKETKDTKEPKNEKEPKEKKEKKEKDEDKSGRIPHKHFHDNEPHEKLKPEPESKLHKPEYDRHEKEPYHLPNLEKKQNTDHSDLAKCDKGGDGKVKLKEGIPGLLPDSLQKKECGPDGKPVVSQWDLKGNPTGKYQKNADGSTTYETNPKDLQKLDTSSLDPALKSQVETSLKTGQTNAIENDTVSGQHIVHRTFTDKGDGTSITKTDVSTNSGSLHSEINLTDSGLTVATSENNGPTRVNKIQ